MKKRGSRRGVFFASMAGVLAGAMLVSMIPAMAATGDVMIAGGPNQAGKATKLRSIGPSTLKLINTRGPGGVALDLITPIGIPPMRVNRTALVDNLNADYLDGFEGSSYLRDSQPEVIQASHGGNLLRVLNNGAGNGIYGQAGSGGDGVLGQAFHGSKSGVYGFHNGNGFGVTGRSSNGFGVLAWGGGDSSGSDGIGDLLLQGTRGEIYTEGDFLNFYSNGNANIVIDNDDDSTDRRFSIYRGSTPYTEIYSVLENGDTWAMGTKSAVVETADFGSRLMYAVESPGVWFEDFGSASLTDGAAVVSFEAIFAETVNLSADYHVYLTPLGDCGGLYVAAKTPTSFEVRELGGGTASIDFDYRIVARRLGYEDVRLEVAERTFGAR